MVVDYSGQFFYGFRPKRNDSHDTSLRARIFDYAARQIDCGSRERRTIRISHSAVYSKQDGRLQPSLG